MRALPVSKWPRPQVQDDRTSLTPGAGVSEARAVSRERCHVWQPRQGAFIQSVRIIKVRWLCPA